MQPEFKSLHSPDVDLESFSPEQADVFSFFAQAMIGPKGEDSEESFGIQVCTPKWLLLNKGDRKTMFGRHLLIVFEFDLAAIESCIAVMCNKISGDDWDDIAMKLGQYGAWEFENYQPYKGAQ